MKIAIIGKGLAGILTAMAWRAHYPATEIEIYYDPDAPIEPVGSGSWPNLLNLIDEFNNSCPESWTNWREAEWDQTVKTGISYKGWGQDWFHDFGINKVAMHFDPKMFCDDMSQYFKCIPKRVGYNIDADYIYDCGGSPFSGRTCSSESFDRYTLLKNPLNRVLLAETDPYTAAFCTTETVATKDGWCFQIPLQSRTSVGYLFNSGITTDEEALDNFAEQFGEHTLIGFRSFHNYMAKNPVMDGRIFMNGNKYFFIEPMEATSITGYMVWIQRTLQYIMQGAILKDIVDDNQRDIQENANFLLYHYAHGSDYNTPFWEYARSLYEPCPVFNNIIEDAKKLKWRHMGRQYNYSYFSFPSVIATYCNHETKQDYKSLLRNNW
tara:strand:+ start:633 stop:1772 length:1140 start_codon:yes stop_codon:yes gene_type:complete